jgi:murein DD-endopeptidase MepM/ murein hydrolase activator NlpD
MNPGLWLIKRAKKELLIVLGILGVITFLPILTVAVIAATGVSAASNALAAVNPVTKLVEIFDSKGNKVQELTLSTTWPATGYVSDEFGTRQAFRSNLGLGSHTGIDIANEQGKVGTPVTTFMTGDVIRVDDIDNDACGINVKINHDNGITSLYCHLLSTNVTEMQSVSPGDIIGYMGSSGTSTGAHVHFQINVNSIPVNPRTFMVGEPQGTYAGD